jgi:hypothetical protein
MQKRLFITHLFFQSVLFCQGDAAGPLSAPLTYQEWQEAKLQLSQAVDEDVIILNDGSQLTGSFDMLPPLYYSFGQMSFNVEEIDTAIFFTKEETLKGQYITRNGQNFVAAVKAEELPYNENQEAGSRIPKKLDSHKVKSLFFKDSHSKACSENFDLFSLELSNGDELPLSPESVLINVTEAGKNKKIPLADIVEVSFNGGLTGSILEEGSLSTLRFALVNDKYFFAYLTRKHHLVKLPWTQISQIQGFNGGFKDRDPTLFAENEPVEEKNTVAFEPLILPEEKPSALEIPLQLIGFAPEAFNVFEQPLDIQEQNQHTYNQPGVQATIILNGAPRRAVR